MYHSEALQKATLVLVPLSTLIYLEKSEVKSFKSFCSLLIIPDLLFLKYSSKMEKQNKTGKPCTKVHQTSKKKPQEIKSHLGSPELSVIQFPEGKTLSHWWWEWHQLAGRGWRTNAGGNILSPLWKPSGILLLPHYTTAPTTSVHHRSAKGCSLTALTCLLPGEHSSLQEHFLFWQEEREFKGVGGEEVQFSSESSMVMPTWKAVKAFQKGFWKSGH